jgi:hypothetical protein
MTDFFDRQVRAETIDRVASGETVIEIALGNDKVRILDLMGQPLAGRRFTPDSTPVYLTASGLTDDEFCNATRD